MSALEKQFLQMQRDITRMKYEVDETPDGMSPDMTDTAYDETGIVTRISGLEDRVASLESQVRYLQQSGPPVEAVPVEPEQIGMPDETPPPVIVEPAGKAQEKRIPTRTVGDMYSEAVNLYRSGELDKSEATLSALLEDYPDDNKYSDNAQYYIGSIYYQREDYHRAIEEFDKVVTNFPVGDKVPDAIYMMGLSYKRLGIMDRARLNFNRVMDNYPYSDAALKARQALEEAE